LKTLKEKLYRFFLEKFPVRSLPAVLRSRHDGGRSGVLDEGTYWLRGMLSAELSSERLSEDSLQQYKHHHSTRTMQKAATIIDTTIIHAVVE